MKHTFRGYYFITDASLSRAGNLRDVQNAVSCGVAAVQYRNKEGSTRQMLEEARAIRALCTDALFLVNDRIDIALAAGADGVHIGQDDMPFETARKLLGKDRIIGLTVHTVEEANEAERLGADYVGVSPIFSTATKKDAGKPAGLTLIEDVRKRVRIPVVAIGGINLGNAASVIGAGAHGLCAISCVVGSTDVAGEIRKFQTLFGIAGK